MILAIFDLQVTPMLSTKFQVIWPFGSREAKNRFSRRQPFCISYQKDFSQFYLQVTPMLPTKFQVSWPFASGEIAKNRFSRWISDRNDFNIFDQVILMLPVEF